MGLGRLVELCVSVVTIVNYCAQCELLIFYIREITLRMEEKTKDLDSIMKVMVQLNILAFTPSHYKNCVVDSKEKYKFDLEGKGLIDFRAFFLLLLDGRVGRLEPRT